MQEPLAVHAEGLSVRRGANEVLHELSFTIPRGLVIGLLGPSGCGKTTLMRALVGVQRNVTGTLEVLGRPAGQAELRARVAYLTQAPSVYSDLTVRENLRYFTSILGAEERDIAQVLARVQMSALADRVIRSSPAASRRGSRSRARCLRVQSCSCSMSPRSGSIHCCVASCGRCSRSSPERARRCSSHRT